MTFENRIKALEEKQKALHLGLMQMQDTIDKMRKSLGIGNDCCADKWIEENKGKKLVSHWYSKGDYFIPMFVINNIIFGMRKAGYIDSYPFYGEEFKPFNEADK